MLFCFATHEFSLTRLCLNKAFPVAWGPMLMVLTLYIYLPVYIMDQGFAPLDGLGAIVAFSLVLAFFVVFELTKLLHRSIFEDELLEKTIVARLISEGCLPAFPSRAEAWIKCPHRKPLLTDEGTAYGSCEQEHSYQACVV